MSMTATINMSAHPLPAVPPTGGQRHPTPDDVSRVPMPSTTTAPPPLSPYPLAPPTVKLPPHAPPPGGNVPPPVSHHAVPSPPVMQPLRWVANDNCKLPPRPPSTSCNPNVFPFNDAPVLPVGFMPTFDASSPEGPPESRFTFPPPIIPRKIKAGSLSNQPLSQPLPAGVPLPAAPRAPPRPHPYVRDARLYITTVPPEITQADVVDALIRQGVHGAVVEIYDAVDPRSRLMPNVYYNWMGKHGLVSLSSLLDAEKAHAILDCHPYLAKHCNMLVSPFEQATGPLPPTIAAPRIIRPTRQAANGEYLPSEGDIWDAVRGWGSIRTVTIALELDESVKALPPRSPRPVRWRAQVEFWHEDEAAACEADIAAAGMLIGWHVTVHKDPSFIPMPNSSSNWSPHVLPVPHGPHTAAPLPPYFAQPQGEPMVNFNPAIGVPPALGVPANCPAIPTMPPYPAPEVFMTMEPLPQVPHIGVTSQPPPTSNHGCGNVGGRLESAGPMDSAPLSAFFGPMPGHGHIPPSPPQSQYTMTPWSSHSKFAKGIPLPDTSPGLTPLPLGNINHGNDKSKKQWRLVPGGIVSNEGSVIQYVPGQHTSSAPKNSRGRHNTSGPVNTYDLIVKNLDADISSFYLADMFLPFGCVVNARVMRDNLGRSRGFGFVSFSHINEASEAIAQMNGQKVGTRAITVNHHKSRNPPRRTIKRSKSNLDRRGPEEGKTPSETNKIVSEPARATVPPPVTHGFPTPADTPESNPQASPDVAVSLPPTINVTTITLAALATLPPSLALNVLHIGGNELTTRLDLLKTPYAARIEGKHDLIRHINRVLDPIALGTSKSRVLHRIRGFVNSLNETDEHAFALILEYPSLALAMILNHNT